MTNPYKNAPKCILTRLTKSNESLESYCAGFELSEWRCSGLADNLIEWIIDYALKSDELRDTNHTNTFVRLKQAASRVYTSAKYERRGEVGEIAAHAVCRTYFNTIPVAARVNYLSASNDPVKAFDLVHVRYIGNDDIELWLGEAKFFKSRNDAISDAIASIKGHITAGFLKNEKLLLGPQVSNDIPHSAKIKQLLSAEASLDDLIASAVFPVLIAANSDATGSHVSVSDNYSAELEAEMQGLWKKLKASGLNEAIKLKLIYVPLGDKDALNKAFDERLKGLQIG
ncbi:hypothetical protein DSM110093_03139 [Sulfitobacter sp. DSM 110093]|uniref:HamA C-terminal domain-containing protein n=1 Tax=Sulfitobacter sp. DSM 110093 TaxID=2883127 RepID=UPI001FAB4D37|nr:DUF1837 domain-containing protein [Sulfitobacter sp. DSM 110093]UOA33314.1 hypothetical protein DSM110093_03139 [Sulfitobacter sp. DSM 110093]